MYKEKEKCRAATISQLLKRKKVVVANLNGLMSFVMGSISCNKSKCGKKYCACHDKTSPKLHGPYRNLSYRGGDKIGSVFLTDEKAPIAEKMVGEYATLREVLKEISCINLELFRRKEFDKIN